MQVVYLAIDFRKHKWEGGESEVGKGEEALKDVLMSTLLLGATGVQILPPLPPWEAVKSRLQNCPARWWRGWGAFPKDAHPLVVKGCSWWLYLPPCPLGPKFLVYSCFQQSKLSRCCSKPSGRAAERDPGTVEIGEPGTALNSSREGDVEQSISTINIFPLQDGVYFSPLLKHSLKNLLLRVIKGTL